MFDFHTRYCQWARRLFGVVTPPVSDTFPDNWDYMDAYITKDQDRELWKEIGQSDQFWQNLPIYTHTSRLLNTALDKAGKIYYITSRSGRRVQYQTERALIGIVGPAYFTGGVIPVSRHEDKIALINGLRLSHFIDDRPDTLVLANEHCSRTKIAQWMQPWNNQFSLKPHVEQLSTVEEFSIWLQ